MRQQERLVPVSQNSTERVLAVAGLSSQPFLRVWTALGRLASIPIGDRMADTNGKQATMWVACIECHRPTSHDVVEQLRFLEGDDGEPLYRRTYNIIRCRGCRAVSFAET